MGKVGLVDPKPASLMATTEPLAATGVGILWLGIPFGGMDWLACGCIIASMVLITLFPGLGSEGRPQRHATLNLQRFDYLGQDQLFK